MMARVKLRSVTLGDDQREFVRQAMNRNGWTVSELATRAGLDHSTLSRFLRGSREGHILRHSSIVKIEQASGILFAAGQAAPPPPRPAGFTELEATPLALDRAEAGHAAIEAVIAGCNNAGPWVLRSRALEALGYRPGDILVVELGAEPRAGDVVCAQVYDWTRGQAETVFRLYQPPCIIAVSPDAGLLRPHIVDGPQVTIRGVVTHTIRLRAAH